MATVTVGGVLVTVGCATVAEQPEDWRPQEEIQPQAAPEPQNPDGGSSSGPGGAGGQPPPSQVPPPDGCTDFHPAVIATCLNQLTAVAALPGDGRDPSALVGERTTGRILRVKKDVAPEVVAVAPVDASTDGGLTGLALSPTYAEDQLIFAYLSTPTDNRLVRIAPGDTPKPVLTGIPRGATGNRGALAVDHRGALLLATGDAGNPALAADPKSLAGKVLRLDANGRPAPDNPDPATAVIASGLRTPGGVCASLDGSRMWVTDQGADRDLLYLLQPGEPMSAPAWSWPDRPGVAGCASTPNALWVATARTGSLQTLPIAEDGSFSGKPVVNLAKEDGFGLLSGMDLVNEQVAIGGTINKGAGGQPVSSDDRAVTILMTNSSGSGGPD
ncbi:PQQ-dependent sugar dehydrogenase [Actinophytocola sediminis]